MFLGLIKKQKEAFQKGHEYSNALHNAIVEYNNSNNTLGDTDKYLGVSAIDMANFIYSNNIFYDYVKQSLIGKKYDRIINTIKLIALILLLLITIFVYNQFGKYAAIITGTIAVVIYVMLLIKLSQEENYKEYYNSTFLALITNPDEYSKYSLGTSSLTNEEINEDLLIKFTSKILSNRISANIKNNNGKYIDIQLKNTTTHTNSNGVKSSTSEIVFNGFYMKLVNSNNFSTLKGNTIKIIEDENLLSHLAEDTVKSIYESSLEYSFNSEELNKSLDCKMSGSSNFIDRDDAMHTVAKIITPAFEEHLLYLKGRYNSFNMNISDTEIKFWVNMRQSMFQKIKNGDLLDFKTTYKEKYTLVGKPLISILGYEEFAFYNVFPFMEKLYFIKYIYYMYNTYMNNENYYSVNSEIIKSYETKMKTIYDMDVNEFKKMYSDNLKNSINE